MRKKLNQSSVLWTAILVIFLLDATIPVIAADGKKYFREGVKLAENKQWDKAAERLALAVAEQPSNAEFQLHLQRALVNAAIQLIDRGDRLAAQRDYNAAYNAYRQACAFDTGNTAAAVKMRLMLEAQGIALNTTAHSGRDRKTSQDSSTSGVLNAGSGQSLFHRSTRPTKTDVIVHNGNLLGVIEQLAQSVRLNVAFDQQAESLAKARPLNIELRDVTPGEALETILETNNLAYVQVGVRTLVITMDNPQNRARYEPMSLRTFYPKNVDVNDMRNSLASTMGAKQIISSKQVNALVARDSRANLEMIDSMIASLDKSKAEVLIDINLYEVSKNDLLQFGNQFTASGGTGLSASNLGGVYKQLFVLQNSPRTLTGPLDFAIGLPSSTLIFFQDKGKAKLLASTQVHVLDNEQHQIRIGQRVPVKTGSSPVVAVGSTSPNAAAPSSGFTTIDNIQYENVGLNIDVQPQVFDDEVQVKMKIEASSVDRSTGDLTPSFNQRTMSSVARIKDGQTTMIAGVSRTEDSKQVKGLPIIGLIPILGRFFVAPSTSNQQSDVVITVTPHILRRADITSDNHYAIDAGRGPEVSRQFTIQQIINLANEADGVQSPVATDVDSGTKSSVDAGPAAFAPEPRVPVISESSGIVRTTATTNAAPGTAPTGTVPRIGRHQIDKPGTASALDDDDDDSAKSEDVNKPVLVSVRCSTALATVGQNFYVAISLTGDARIASSVIVLDYDANLFEVRRVANTGLLQSDPQFTTDNGQLRVRLNQTTRVGVPARGQLLLIVMAAKARGSSALMLNSATRLWSASDEPIPMQLNGATVEAR
jgi:general secretion pathway protein D